MQSRAQAMEALLAVVALPLVLLAVNAMNVHFYARPHIFTLLLLAAAACRLPLVRELRHLPRPDEPSDWLGLEADERPN